MALHTSFPPSSSFIVQLELNEYYEVGEHVAEYGQEDSPLELEEPEHGESVQQPVQQHLSPERPVCVLRIRGPCQDELHRSLLHLFYEAVGAVGQVDEPLHGDDGHQQLDYSPYELCLARL